MYKLMIGLWSTIKDDYIIGEYSGITHKLKTDAQKELQLAIEDCKDNKYVESIYIIEV